MAKGLVFVDLDADNVDQHHLCCALGDPKHVGGLEDKRRWMKRRFREGLKFRKLDVRGKVFIEYMPAETSWRPVVAPGYLVVHCLWVSGKYQGQGHARALVEACIEDARSQGKRGVCIIAGTKKRPFLADPRFLKHLGFEIVDRAATDFCLFALTFDGAADGPAPRLSPAMQRPEPEGEARGPFAMTYTDQCPFNAHWVFEAADALRTRGYDVDVRHLTRGADARRSRSPLGAFGLTRGDVLVTHHLPTDAGIDRLLAKNPSIAAH